MVGRVICLWGFSSVLIAWLFAWWVGGFLGGGGVGFGFFFPFFFVFFFGGHSNKSVGTV